MRIVGCRDVQHGTCLYTEAERDHRASHGLSAWAAGERWGTCILHHLTLQALQQHLIGLAWEVELPCQANGARKLLGDIGGR